MQEARALWAKLATGHHDWLAVRRNGKYVLGRPRSSTVMQEEPAASPDPRGDVHRIEFLSPLQRTPRWEACRSPEDGGALLDLGYHAVDQARHLSGPVRSVYAELYLAPGEVGFDKGFFVALHQRAG
ncbi:Oxidoreductase family, C-terminal alpha/beta domain [Geodermatophilus africanus]|uniref:Oxidoreductase family, C-terminal alpha/beta domain n=1 Tax=Geodermatophilus africanus TaxID=1137993 RepID=A0A1H3LMS8_9ACTN|nr:hypothetical protein [Geodermatophilus africanus]SDY65742.1 Oxidoreductase family, C-terminal alpha/beta domain [Geodermatophilus africanus]